MSLLHAVALAGCAAAHTSGQPAGPVYGMTPGRLGAIAAALVALIGLIIGGRALARARRAGNGRRGATVALVAGLIGMALGGFIVATADGGIGTGRGLGGAIVALVLGMISVILGGLARARSGR